MVLIKAHFDGKVLVPDEPVDLPPGQALLLHVQRLDQGQPAPHAAQALSGEQLLNSGLVGMWQDRSELPDSPAYARQLRAASQHR